MMLLVLLMGSVSSLALLVRLLTGEELAEAAVDSVPIGLVAEPFLFR